MIKAIPNDRRSIFYNNESLNELVDLSLEYVNHVIFEDILSLISSKKIENIDFMVSNLLEEYKDLNFIFEDIQRLLHIIFEDQNCDNLKGAFLELIIYKYINNKYSILKNSNLLDMDCFVEINGFKSDRTVDVFALCVNLGFICECKIGTMGFEDHDISNLNNLYILSNKRLNPFIISLAPKEHIERALNKDC